MPKMKMFKKLFNIKIFNNIQIELNLLPLDFRKKQGIIYIDNKISSKIISFREGRHPNLPLTLFFYKLYILTETINVRSKIKKVGLNIVDVDDSSMGKVVKSFTKPLVSVQINK